MEQPEQGEVSGLGLPAQHQLGRSRMVLATSFSRELLVLPSENIRKLDHALALLLALLAGHCELRTVKEECGKTNFLELKKEDVLMLVSASRAHEEDWRRGEREPTDAEASSMS